MSDDGETTVAGHPHRVHVRVRAGLAKSHNWLQLAKFCAVGGSGYVVNLVVFALCVEALGFHHLVAATCAFLVAVLNNFWWNRRWTFVGARGGRAGFQAARFVAVSVATFLVALTILELLVTLGGVSELPAQAISIAVSTPLNFIGNKLWSFAIEVSRD